MTGSHTPPPERGRLVSDRRAVRGGLATDASTGGDDRGGLENPALDTSNGGHPEGESSEARLLAALAWKPPIHPAVAMALIADLSRSLVDAVLVGSDGAAEAHRQLVRLAQVAIDAADRLEKALAEGGRFEWRNPRVEFEALLDRLDDAMHRADVANARYQAYRQGRVDEHGRLSEVDCAFP